MRIAFESAPYIKFSVAATTPAGVTLDVSGDVVEFSFVVPGTRPITWHTGFWAGGNAVIQVGVGVIPLAAGRWEVWLRVTDTPEIVAGKYGELVVY